MSPDKLMLEDQEISITMPDGSEPSIEIDETGKLTINVNDLSMILTINDEGGWTGNGRFAELNIAGQESNGMIIRQLLLTDETTIGNGRVAQIILANGSEMNFSADGGPVIIGNGRTIEFGLAEFKLNFTVGRGGMVGGGGRIALELGNI